MSSDCSSSSTSNSNNTSCCAKQQQQDMAPPKPLSIEEIQRRRLFGHIYSEDSEQFVQFLTENPSFLSECYGGYCLIHHLVDFYWEDGLSLYETVLHGDMSLKTKDVLLSLDKSIPLYITGGRNFLHLLALRITGDETKSVKEREIFTQYCTRFPELALVRDFNGYIPSALADRTSTSSSPSQVIGSAAWRREEYLRVKSRCYIDLSPYAPFTAPVESSSIDPSIAAIEDVRPLLQGTEFNNVVMHSFTANSQLVSDLTEEVESLAESIPNSMHRYGKILLPAMQDSVYRLVHTLLLQDKEHRSHIDKITSIYAFYIKYNAADATSQKTNQSLGKHRDDSTITINLCLKNTSTTGALIMDDLQGYCYKHVQGKGVFHQGNLAHHVEEITDGERENIIIWVRF